MCEQRTPEAAWAAADAALKAAEAGWATWAAEDAVVRAARAAAAATEARAAFHVAAQLANPNPAAVAYAEYWSDRAIEIIEQAIKRQQK
jgi:hypothetical protein